MANSIFSFLAGAVGDAKHDGGKLKTLGGNFGRCSPPDAVFMGVPADQCLPQTLMLCCSD